MSTRGLLASVVLLAALAGIVWWSVTNDRQDDAGGKGSKDNPKLVSVKDEDVTKLEIQRRDGESVVLQRDKNGWAMQSPKAVHTDTEAVAGVVSTMTGLTWDRLVEDKGGDPGQFGLSQPALQVSVTGKDGKRTTLQVGDDTPAGGAWFAKLDGDPRIFSISGGVKAGVDKTWRDLRDKRLITSDDQKLSRVEVNTGKSAPVEFGRTGDNDWQILKPRPLRADGFAVDELIRKVRDAKLPSAATDQEESKRAAEFAVGTRVALVTLTDPSGTQTLDVRKKGEEYLAKSSAGEAVATVDKDLADTLTKPLDDFRAKKLFDFGFSEPSKIDIHDGSKSLSLSKSGEKWWHNGKEMDPTSVQSLIDKLRDLQATSLTDSGFTTSALDISVVSNGGKRTEKVQFSKGATTWFAKRENEPTVYATDNKKVEDIRSAAADVKPVAPAPAPAKK
jgi:hypothetical protein